MTFGEVAFAAYVPANYPRGAGAGPSEKSFYDPLNFTYPAGSHIAEVEIDPETGVVEVVAFTAVDDFGKIINPMIVEGQVHGGVAQGIGQALLEHGDLRRDGQLLTGSYMDYAMPRADDLPSFVVDTTVTPCTHNPLGVKGCGEAGAIGAPAAIMNAVTDALGVRGSRHAGDARSASGARCKAPRGRTRRCKSSPITAPTASPPPLPLRHGGEDVRLSGRRDDPHPDDEAGSGAARSTLVDLAGLNELVGCSHRGPERSLSAP